MVRRQGQDDLGGSGDKVSGGLLDLDGTEQSEQVGQHESVGKLRLVVDAVDLSAVLGQSSEGDDVVKVDLEGGVDVVDQGLGVLLRSWGELRRSLDLRRNSPPLKGTTISLDPLDPSSWKMFL